MNIPEHVAPVSMLVFGYPTEQQKNRAQLKRLPKESVVFENSYRELSEEELMGASPYESTKEKVKALYNRKYVSKFAKEMVRSVKVIYENWHQK